MCVPYICSILIRKKRETRTHRLNMEGAVVGLCVNTDGGVSYVACPWCYARLCPSYHQFQACTYNDIMLEDTGSSSSDTEQLEDDFVYNCLRSLAGFPYAQLELTPDMWVACSNFKELAEARVGDRPFGRIGDFKRLAEELAWDVPAGIVVVNLEREKTLVFKAGEEPSAIGGFSALAYLRLWTAGGLLLLDDGQVGFLENHYQPGGMHTTIRRLIRLAVLSWEE